MYVNIVRSGSNFTNGRENLSLILKEKNDVGRIGNGCLPASFLGVRAGKQILLELAEWGKIKSGITVDSRLSH